MEALESATSPRLPNNTLRQLQWETVAQRMQPFSLTGCPFNEVFLFFFSFFLSPPHTCFVVVTTEKKKKSYYWRVLVNGLSTQQQHLALWLGLVVALYCCMALKRRMNE